MGTVSIIIPAYNTADTLDRCLSSVLAQTYTDFEVIVVNDGSTDGTREKILSYTQREQRIRLIDVAHGGVSGARNAGVREARGEYLQFLDADDDIEPDFLAKMIGLMERENADMAVCRFDHPFFHTYCEDEVFDLTKEEDFQRFYQETFALVVPWNRVWRRECFVELYDEEVHFSEDELGNLANLRNVKRVVTTKDVLYHYFFVKPDEEQAEKQENSCISNILNEDAFWNNRSSFYFRGASLLEKRRKYIESAIRDGKCPVKDPEEIVYQRPIDYCFWQMPPFIAIGTPEEGLCIEYKNIFEESGFRRGFAARSRYGVSLKADMTKEEKDEAVRTYVRLCVKAFKAKINDLSFRLVDAFIEIFLALFARCDRPNPIDCNARRFMELESGSTREARFVRELLAGA